MNPALVVIDMQTCWLGEGKGLHPDLTGAVQIIERVAAAFRTAGRAVIWLQDRETVAESDPGYAIIEGLTVRDGDLRVSKIASNAFIEAGLPEALKGCGADFALLCGYRAEQCVLATARGAADRAFPYALLRGATLSFDPQAPAFVERISPLLTWEVAVALAR